MSKGSHEVTESVSTRLCEWRGLNGRLVAATLVAATLVAATLVAATQTVDKTLLVSTPEAFFLFWVQKVCT